MGEVEEPSFEKFDWDTLARRHPDDDDREPWSLTTADVVRVLQAGDQLVYQDRELPFDVIGRDESYSESRYDTGYREVAFELSSPRSKEFIIGNWWHWGDDGDGFEDTTGLWPQCTRVKNWKRDAHTHELAVDFSLRALDRVSPDIDSFSEGDKVIHLASSTDRHHAGMVMRTEFGELVLTPIDGRPIVDAPYSMDPEKVIYHREVSH